MDQPKRDAAPTLLALARRASHFVRPQRTRVLGVTALALVVAALGAAQPLVLKRLFDQLGERSGASALALTLGALLALEAVRTVFGGWLGIVTWDVRLGVDYAVRERLIGKLYTLPMSYHDRHAVGGIMNQLNQGVTGLVNAFGELAFNLLPALAYLALSLVAMWRLDWRLALLVIAFTPLPALIGIWAAKEQTRRERLLMSRWTTLYSRLNEVLAGIKTVKSFAMEEVERRRFLSGQRAGNAIVRKGVRTDTFTGALRDFAATLARLVALAVGSFLILRGDITVGTLVAILGYIGGLFGPVQGLTNIYQTVQRGQVALETVFDILDAPDVVADPPDAVDLPEVRGDVAFENVTFGYDGAAPVLTGIDLDVRAGETIAIVGPSGSGKTTLMMLLQRHFPLTGGRITVDGLDVRQLSQRSLRDQVAVVWQDVNLFNDTIRDNIAYGRITASDEEIEAAARAANAHDFISALPEGYETVVGEHGSRLSGGQRQRIAIARALLKNPPILVLDEATSALDAQSEALVQEALRTLTRGRTTFVIAHRLATVVNADRILVLRDGRIEAVGRHDDLLRENAYYASLVRRQAHGLLAAA